MSRKVDRWRREDLSKRYLDDVRSAIPLADYQVELILTIIEKTELEVRAFLDLGCGDGILGRAILSEYPEATGVFLDFSDTMIEAARQKAPDGVQALAREAIRAGASKEEIAEALRVAQYVCGVGCVYTAARALKEVLK
jgi:trans-aconitate methyltransferase